MPSDAPPPHVANPAPSTLSGQPAAPGLAIGPLLRLRGPRAGAAAEQGSPEAERARLDAAIAGAAGSIEALSAASQDELAAEILAFQLALLQDPELVAPARGPLAEGASAEAAWDTAIGELIAVYAEDADPYFQARADDLRDLRQRVRDLLTGGGAPRAEDLPEGAILVADTLTPSRFLEIDWTKAGGAALAHGSATSHMAMLARARGVPLLTGLGEAALQVPDGVMAVLDAEGGQLVVAPEAAALRGHRARLRERAEADARDASHRLAPAVTADGTPVTVLVNVEDPAALAEVDPAIADGVGLTRTEFLFQGGLADEATQRAAYGRVLAWAAGRPVTIRTLDAGGDKPIPGFTPDGESNPFLGQRGLRLSLARPDVFRTQLRALLRAAADGPLKVMLPMVTLPREFVAARALLHEVRAELAAEGEAVPEVAFGIMVETPLAALQPEAYAADFYSIGTNDLIQYVTAAARDIESVAPLQDPTLAPIAELIGRVVDAGAARGVEVSVCGEMAARPELVPGLLDAGVRVLSVPPAAVGRVKRAVAQHRLRGTP